jgi:nucleotide-binding universal stress UspA family protein
MSVAGPIICGVDESLSARGAARVARALGRQLGRTLIFVRVVERAAPAANVSAVAERLERLSEEATDVDCGAAWLVDAGHPADRLVAAARAFRASLIVVGSRGPRSSLLGSISADVSRRAPCPVVVVPAGTDACVTGYERRTDGENGDAERRGPRADVAPPGAGSRRASEAR